MIDSNSTYNHFSRRTESITLRTTPNTYKTKLSKIGENIDRQRMSGTIVGMNCHPHLPTRSFFKHPITVNTVSSNNLRKEQPFKVFNSKVYKDMSNVVDSSLVASSSCTINGNNVKKRNHFVEVDGQTLEGLNSI